MWRLAIFTLQEGNLRLTGEIMKIKLPFNGFSRVIYSGLTVHFAGEKGLAWLTANRNSQTYRISRRVVESKKHELSRSGFEVEADPGNEAMVKGIVGMLLAEKVALLSP
mgnify:CR=1 FL=1